MEKQCFKCKETKSIDDFYKHKQMKDGHLNKCKECTKTDVKTDRIVSPNARAYDIRRYQENPNRHAAGVETARQWRIDNPKKYKAQTALNNAVRDGKVRKEACMECGTFENVHGHHWDYNRPLDVEWRCALHHARHHRDEREGR